MARKAAGGKMVSQYKIVLRLEEQALGRGAGAQGAWGRAGLARGAGCAGAGRAGARGRRQRRAG